MTTATRAQEPIIRNQCIVLSHFSVIFIIAASLSLLIHTIPLLLDVLLPLNESRVQGLHLETEYFLDPSKYFFLFAAHFTIYMFLEMFVTLATGSSFYSYLLHACAVFKITKWEFWAIIFEIIEGSITSTCVYSYRMEVMIDQDVLRILSPERERVILERLVYAVHLHRRNILFVRYQYSKNRESFRHDRYFADKGDALPRGIV